MRLISEFKKCPVNYSAPFDILCTEDSFENDRVVKKTKVKQFDPAAEHSKYVASDFYMENIVAAGAYDMLKPVKLSDTGLDAVDSLDIAVEDTFDAIDYAAAKNNEEK